MHQLILTISYDVLPANCNYYQHLDTTINRTDLVYAVSSASWPSILYAHFCCYCFRSRNEEKRMTLVIVHYSHLTNVNKTMKY